MKAEDILFSEKQHFNMWMVISVLLVSLIPVSVGVISYLNGNTGSTAMGRTTMLLVTGVILLVTVLLAVSKLETRITRKGIAVRLFPFQLDTRFISWEDIHSATVRKYNPLFEYGGWGIKGFRDDRALNVKGNMGMQLVLKDGKRLLIGTDKPEELEHLLRVLKQGQ